MFFVLKLIAVRNRGSIFDSSLPMPRFLVFLACILLMSSFASAADKKPIAKEGWLDIHSAHFEIITDAGEKRAREVALRLEQMRKLAYNDLSADRNTVAVVQALEAILERHAHGQPASVVEVNTPQGGLVLRPVGQTEPEVLYTSSV